MDTFEQKAKIGIMLITVVGVVAAALCFLKLEQTSTSGKH